MHTVKILLFSCLGLMLSFNEAYSQKLDAETIQQMITAKRFIFAPQTVSPLGAPTRTVTADFDLELRGDSMISYLPYFGRSYVAVLPGENTLNFTSTDFSYTETKRGKKGWRISIRPKDAKDVREYLLTISRNGYTNLTVTSNNKQPITFYGSLEKKPEKQ